MSSLSKAQHALSYGGPPRPQRTSLTRPTTMSPTSGMYRCFAGLTDTQRATRSTLPKVELMRAVEPLSAYVP